MPDLHVFQNSCGDIVVAQSAEHATRLADESFNPPHGGAYDGHYDVRARGPFRRLPDETVVVMTVRQTCAELRAGRARFLGGELR